MKTNVALKSGIKAITYRHAKMLYNLQKLKKHVNTKTKQHPDFSLYILLSDEEIAFSYGLEHRIASILNKTDTDAEFEQFYKGHLPDISNIPEKTLSTLKMKLRGTCKKYRRRKFKHNFTFYFEFCILFLPLVLIWIYFDRFYGSYQ